ncbi:hypothetical protein C2G38_2220819 [Gigaspora rosea]|uniref:Uncharacterized protein n=1 Tax=Gigaspora rosea TaxID=44941 RepID=A0A397U447_9GLOM|nr:hypothetical protein C2G38_2220817 [Gigaspora rosea]RIB05014.1 hypothetical protein C2G38_2220819 [Gigaspora rosea]
MTSKHDQLLNIINLSNTTESNSENQMDIDHDDELIIKHNDNWGQDYNDDPIELELEDFELDYSQLDDDIENNSEDKNNAKIKQQDLLEIICMSMFS